MRILNFITQMILMVGVLGFAIAGQEKPKDIAKAAEVKATDVKAAEQLPETIKAAGSAQNLTDLMKQAQELQVQVNLLQTKIDLEVTRLAAESGAKPSLYDPQLIGGQLVFVLKKPVQAVAPIAGPAIDTGKPKVTEQKKADKP